MASTTIKLSVETRDRLKALGGATYEDTILEALDLLEAERFWQQADRYKRWRASLPPEAQERLDRRDAEAAAVWDSVAD